MNINLTDSALEMNFDKEDIQWVDTMDEDILGLKNFVESENEPISFI